MNTHPFLSLVPAILLALAFRPPAARAQNEPQIVWSTNGQDFIYAVNFSADGRFLATAADDTQVKVWSVADHALVRTFSVGGAAALSVALSPDGSLVAAGDGDGSTRVWRVNDGVRLWINSVNNDFVYSLAFSFDGTLLAIGRTDTLVATKAVEPQGVFFVETEGAVYGVSFTADDRLLASAGSTANVWRVPEGTLVRTLIGHSNTVYSVDFSPDGALLATASGDGTARLWRVADGSMVRVIEGGGSVAKFAASGQLLVTLNGGPISIWRVSTGTWLHTYTNANATALAVAPDGEQFAYGRSDGALVLARLPLWISQISYQDFGITLRWQGGSGHYQVQARNAAASGVWQNLGAPTTNTFFSHVCIAPMFYRVQSLTNAL